MSDVRWEDLDARKLYKYSTVGLMGTRLSLYPLMLVKTRAQVLSSPVSLTSVYASQGVRGLWKGALPVSMGVVPTQMLYLTVLEVSRDSLRLALPQQDARNFAAGALASLASSSLGVPLDVVTQRVQLHAPGEGSFRSVASSLMRSEGPRAFYRGFVPSLLQFAPTSGVWWASYARSRQLLGHLAPWMPATLLDASSGACSGGLAALLTMPLDVAKTRLQVAGEQGLLARESYFAVVRRLYRLEGIRGFFRGLSSRATVMAFTGSAMISSYEFIKRISLKEVT